MLKMEKKTLVSFDTKFRTFLIFAGEVVAETVFKPPEFEFVIKIEVARFYEVLDVILRLFLVKFQIFLIFHKVVKGLLGSLNSNLLSNFPSGVSLTQN